MKSFSELAAAKAAAAAQPKKKNKKYKKPPTPIKQNIKKSPRCRVAPLIVARKPQFLDLPIPKHCPINQIDILLKNIYRDLLILEEEIIDGILEI